MRERPFGLICIALNIFFWNCFVALGEERDERERQTFVVRYKNGDQTIPVTVVLDYKKQTEYVINMNNRSPAKSVTLYDFKQRTIAYKDLTNRECFLGSLTYETLNEESEALQYIKNPVDAQPIKVLSLDPGRLAMTPTEIRNVAGQKTAVFCRKMTTWMLKTNNQTHNKHKREAGDEEEVEERTYSHHGFHTVRFSHYGHETRRRYRKRTEGASSQETQHGHRKTTSVHPAQNRTVPSWKHPVHHGLNSPDNDLQNSESYFTSNLGESVENQENRRPFSAHNAIPFSHLPESNENAHNYKGYGRFDDTSLHTTISDDSGLVSRTERETTPMEILPHYFPLNSNYSHEAKLLSLYSPDETGIKYDSSDFHGQIESNVLPLDYNQNYYPYYNNRPVSDLESYSSSANDKDFPGKGFQNNNDFFTTDNPVFSNSALERPNTTEKFESLHQQKPFVNTSQESPSFRFYSNEIANPIPSKSKMKNTELNQKEDQSLVSNNYFLKSTKQSNEKNQFLSKDNPIIFSKNHDGLSFPATTQSTFEEHTVDSFEIINDKKTNEREYKSSAQNLGTYESQESLPTHKPRHNIVQFKNILNQHRTDLTLTEKERLRFQNEPIGMNWTSTPSDNFNILLTTAPPFLTLTTSDDIALHYQAKFRNVLKLLKPDEIIIDVGRIPTHSPSEILERFNHHKRTFPSTITRPSAAAVSELPLRGAPTETTQPPNTAQLFHGMAPSAFSPFLQLNQNSPRTQDRSEQTSGPARSDSYDRNTAILSGARNHQKRKHKEEGRLQSVLSKFSQGRRSSFQYDQSHGFEQRRIYPRPSRLVNQPRRTFPYRSREQQGKLNALPPGVSMHPRHPQAPYADMVRSNVLQSLPDEQRYRQVRPHRQRHHRRKDRVLNPCCKAGKSPNSPSCCRGRGSACCSTSRSRTHEEVSCCSSAKSANSKQTIPVDSNRVPVRSSGVLDDSPRNHVDNRDRCQKEKMCRTLYQSTQQVIVCRNAKVDGC